MEEHINMEPDDQNSEEIRTPHRHLGMNIKHIREILRIKQSALALKLNKSQQWISMLESKETIDKKTLQEVAAALEVPVTLIKNLSFDDFVYNIQNNFDNSNGFHGESEQNITNSVELVKYTVQSLQKLYEKTIKEQQEEIRLLKKENKELQAENKRLIIANNNQ